MKLLKSQKAVEKLLHGRVILTSYNNRTYKIDEINWKVNPVTCTFPVSVLWLKLIHITAFSACVCGRQLRCSAEIEKFLSLR